MIDKNGRQITRDSEKPDPQFLLNECRFIMKGFRKMPKLETAFAVAEKLLKVLENSDITEGVEELLLELERFADVAESPLLIWKLIYSYRELSRKQKNTPGGRIVRASYRRKSAELFDGVVRLSHTVYNQCAQVIEYAVAAELYHGAGCRDEAEEMLERGLEIYNNTERRWLELYYEAGEIIYLRIINYSKKMSDNDYRLKSFMKLAFYSYTRFLISGRKESLRYAGLAYTICLNYEKFPFEQEKETMLEVLLYLDKAVEEGHKALLDEVAESLRKGIEARLASE